MEYFFDPKLAKRLKKVQRLQPENYQKVVRQIQLFMKDPTHSSLRIHKLKGELGDYWSLSVDIHTRLLYRVSEGKIIFFFFGTHDEVYR